MKNTKTENSVLPVQIDHIPFSVHLREDLYRKIESTINDDLKKRVYEHNENLQKLLTKRSKTLSPSIKEKLNKQITEATNTKVIALSKRSVIEDALEEYFSKRK